MIRKFVIFAVLSLFTISTFSQSRSISSTTKSIVYTRDGGVCKCCGSSISLEYDHVIPFSCGGSSDASNIQLLCKKCNRSKSNSCYCKIHNKKVGNNCCDGNKTNNKVTNSNNSSNSQQCTGTTKKGNRCKKMTQNSNGRCNSHNK